MVARWFNVAFGVWYIVTAFIAGPGSPEFGAHVTLGILIFLSAFLAMGISGFRLVSVLLGAFSLVAPFALGYTSSRFAFHDMALGALVIWAAMTPNRPPRRAVQARAAR